MRFAVVGEHRRHRRRRPLQQELEQVAGGADTDGTILEANDNFLNALGYPLCALLARHLERI